MKGKIFKIKLFHRLPVVIALLRIIATFAVFIWNPFELPFRFFQIIPIVVLAINLFLYLKMFKDSDPIVTLVLPTLVHFLFILVFRKTVVIKPFLPTAILDILYLTFKGIKATAFPFEIEGDEDEFKNFSDLDD